MNCRVVLLLLSLLTFLAVGSGQPVGGDPQDEEDQDDPVENEPTAAPTISGSGAPIGIPVENNDQTPSPTTSVDEDPLSSSPTTTSGVVQSFSPTSTGTGAPSSVTTTAGSMDPTSTGTGAPSSVTTTAGSMDPSSPPIAISSDTPTSEPTEDCTGRNCTDDPDVCSCRPNLECRRRRLGGGSFCSQIPRRERKRLSAFLGIGGAGGRRDRGRIPG